MKKIALLAALALLGAFANFSAHADDDLCDYSRSCRKVCDLKMSGSYKEESEAHQELVLKCAQSITEKLQISQ